MWLQLDGALVFLNNAYNARYTGQGGISTSQTIFCGVIIGKWCTGKERVRRKVQSATL